MTADNSELRQEARASLSGNWGLAIGAFLIYSLVMGSSTWIPPIIGAIVLGGPMAAGVAGFSLNIARGREARFEQIFDGFKNFGNTVGAYCLMFLYVFLWSLLFFIPGIIAAISYSQVFFIMADDDTIEPMDALRKSREMMDGYKWKYFELALTFFALSILCLFTFGIGFLWLIPYMYVTYANFYEDLKGDFMERDGFFDEDDVLDSDLV